MTTFCSSVSREAELNIVRELSSVSDIYEMTDEQLALEYVKGNNKAFDMLLDRNQSKLYQYILFVVHKREVADDVFQDTFVKVIMCLKDGNYVPSGKFSAWLMRIAHNVIMSRYRNMGKTNIVDVDEDNDMSKIEGEQFLEANIESAFINEQVLCDVKHLMNSLPALQREVVFMRYFQDMTFKEIAETTGVSINTALGRMHYAVLNLRRMVRKNDIQLAMV